MLVLIEAELEKLINTFDEAYQHDPELVMRLEKMIDKRQRDAARFKKMQEQAEKQEKRKQESFLRTQQPIFKKAGKQVMYRSPPLRQERRVVADTTEDEANARDHAVFGLYIDRRMQRPQTEPPLVEDAKLARRAPPERSSPDTTAEVLAGVAAAVRAWRTKSARDVLPTSASKAHCC